MVNGQEHESYYAQRASLDFLVDHLSRFEVLTFLATEQAVLHIGCADWPITNLNQNLHIMLDKVASSLDGVDNATEALEMLRPHVKGSLFSNLANA